LALISFYSNRISGRRIVHSFQASDSGINFFKSQEGLKSASFQPFLFMEFLGRGPFRLFSKGFLKTPRWGQSFFSSHWAQFGFRAMHRFLP
jgi:hypothetical protein